MEKKVALVTGSSQGIGLGIAKKLLDNGYIVYLNGRDEYKLKNIMVSLSDNVRTITLDLTIEENIKKAFDIILSQEKRIDLVVGNIGSGKSINGWNVELSEYKRIFDINFFNAVSLGTFAVDRMKKTGGQIIFISSIAGCEALGAPIPYSSAKTALLSFAKSLSNDVAQFNIRVNCISPGNVMFKGSTWDNKLKKDKIFVEEYIETNVPLKAFATPQDIAKAVDFLENSNFITGSNIVIDGGQLNKII